MFVDTSTLNVNTKQPICLSPVAALLFASIARAVTCNECGYVNGRDIFMRRCEEARPAEPMRSAARNAAFASSCAGRPRSVEAQLSTLLLQFMEHRDDPVAKPNQPLLVSDGVRCSPRKYQSR